MEPSLQGKVAVVTGGSKGIGLAIAQALGKAGARVAISARNAADLDWARPSIEAPDIHTVAADVQRPDDAARLIQEVLARFGGLDILVNNAGTGRFGTVEEMSIEAWQQVIDTNLSGVFYCTHAAIPHLKRRGGGWIVNISSLSSKSPFVGGAAYCASKSALNTFTEALMQEVRHDNIRVSSVLPGSVATTFNAPWSEPAGEDWKLSPADVARVVMDLLAHDARSLPSRVELRPSRPRKS